jgi:hypothetical protein
MGPDEIVHTVQVSTYKRFLIFVLDNAIFIEGVWVWISSFYINTHTHTLKMVHPRNISDLSLG